MGGERLLRAFTHNVVGFTEVTNRAINESGTSLTYAQTRLIIALMAAEPVRVSDLGRILDVHKSTLTGIMNTLEQRGFIVREPSPASHREVLVSSTRAGRAAVRAIRSSLETVAGRALSAMEPDEARELVRLMRRFTENVDFLRIAVLDGSK